MTKISSMVAMDPANIDYDNDLIEMVDMSEVGAARNKKMTWGDQVIAMHDGIDARVTDFLAAGDNVTITPGAGTLEIAATPPAPGDITGFNEAVDDRVAALIQAGSGITKSYNDGAGTLMLTAVTPTGGMVFQTSVDCSANPNYPAATKGWTYIVSVAGKIGGASGVSVDIGDVVVALADNVGGTQAAVGASWFVLEHNLAGALLAANNLSDIANAATARANIGAASLLLTVDTVAGTTYTFATADAGKHKRFTNAGAITATVPPNTDDAIPVGARIRCTAGAAGEVTLTPGSGVTLNSRGSALKSAGQFAVFEIEKVATDVWDVLGDVVA